MTDAVTHDLSDYQHRLDKEMEEQEQFEQAVDAEEQDLLSMTVRELLWLIDAEIERMQPGVPHWPSGLAAASEIAAEIRWFAAYLVRARAEQEKNVCVEPDDMFDGLDNLL
jgi:hypothetical protein